MIAATEAARSIYGAYRLARGDASGLNHFASGPDAFWRSFYAAGLVAPLYGMLMVASYMADPSPPAGPLRTGILEGEFYVIRWVAFPLVMVGVTRLLQCGHNYYRFMTAYNWASVIQAGIYTPFALISLGVAGGTGDAAALLALVVLAAVLLYEWFIARSALEIEAGPAAAVVALDLVLELFISAITNRIL